jgi:hypothetical protein
MTREHSERGLKMAYKYFGTKKDELMAKELWSNIGYGCNTGSKSIPQGGAMFSVNNYVYKKSNYSTRIKTVVSETLATSVQILCKNKLLMDVNHTPKVDLGSYPVDPDAYNIPNFNSNTLIWFAHGFLVPVGTIRTNVLKFDNQNAVFDALYKSFVYLKASADIMLNLRGIGDAGMVNLHTLTHKQKVIANRFLGTKLHHTTLMFGATLDTKYASGPLGSRCSTATVNHNFFFSMGECAAGEDLRFLSRYLSHRLNIDFDSKVDPRPLDTKALVKGYVTNREYGSQTLQIPLGRKGFKETDLKYKYLDKLDMIASLWDNCILTGLVAVEQIKLRGQGVETGLCKSWGIPGIHMNKYKHQGGLVLPRDYIDTTLFEVPVQKIIHLSVATPGGHKMYAAHNGITIDIFCQEFSPKWLVRPTISKFRIDTATIDYNDDVVDDDDWLF